MTAPQVLVLRAPGTNCDAETAFAFETCGAVAHRTHLFRVLERPALLDSAQMLCIPGGFSYGDDVGAGVIFASYLRSRLADALHSFLQKDKLVLGICNGFQVLMKAGLLPGGAQTWSQSPEASAATLTWNNNGKYTARWVRLQILSRKCVFLRGMTSLDAPIAHAEGRIAVRGPELVEGWKSQDQVAAVYAPRDSQPSSTNDPYAPLEYPDNPNGSLANIAGLCDPTGRVLGLMPHPERYLFATQHPQWTRQPQERDAGAGLQLFRNAVSYFQ